jgi:hypothetical protein
VITSLNGVSSMAGRGKKLELFFIDGRHDGMLTATVSNWPGHFLVAPRTEFSEALKRKEAGYTGIYLLIGEKEGQPLAYIGHCRPTSSVSGCVKSIKTAFPFP